MTEQLHFHFSLSCIGEGRGTPLQCSCLENPRDGRAWWAAVCGVAQSRTPLKRLSSSSSSHFLLQGIFLTQGLNPIPLAVEVQGLNHWTTREVPMYKNTKILYAAAAAKWLQSCSTLCDLIDGSPPGSAVPGILQARTLEWAAISFSKA